VLYVGKATDLQARVRSHFASDQRRRTGRLLRQLDAVHHRVCPGPLTAAVLEGRLIRAWSPPFNRQDTPNRQGTGRHRPGGVPGAADGPRPRPRRGRRRTWTAEQLASDPVDLLTPLADEVRVLADQQRYEEAGAVRDEADRLRGQLDRHRLVASLIGAGRVVLAVDGEGEVVLDRGVWIGGHGPAGEDTLDLPEDHLDDHLDDERDVVARWIGAHAGAVRILEVGSATGLATPARRIPELTELCARVPASASVGPAA